MSDTPYLMIALPILRNLSAMHLVAGSLGKSPFRLCRNQFILAPVVLVMMVASARATEAWERGYAISASLTPEQREVSLPQYDILVQTNDDVDEISIRDNDSGSAIGHVLLARPLAPALEARLRAVRVSFEYRKDTDRPNRRTSLKIWIMSPAIWREFSREADQARPMPEIAYADAFCIGDLSDDTTTWKTWRSENVAGYAGFYGGAEAMLVIDFEGQHVSAREWAVLRDVRLEASSDVEAPTLRELQYPLKTARTLLTDAQIATARHNIHVYPSAKRCVDAIVESVQPWMEMDDDRIAELIPTAQTPRAFESSPDGCPVHGQELYKHGRFPWILDLNHPFRLQCPVGQEFYPSNDYMAYASSTFTDEASLRGEYVDDGWGWMSPTGERHWLVAYASHWHWHQFIRPAIGNLAKAYVLTGDRAYAHRAALMLALTARQYPAMNYATQSHYSWMVGMSYRGKIVNRIWETQFVRDFADAYDMIWETIDDDDQLQSTLGMDGKAIRGLIEANLIEAGIDAVASGDALGNFGMHQSALAKAVIVRQHAPSSLLTSLLTNTGDGLAKEGLNYALYNLVSRDGHPYETAPNYNRLWVSHLTGLAELLLPGGINLYREPKVKDLALSQSEIVVAGEFVPALGDSGDVMLPGDRTPVDQAQRFYRVYGDRRLASVLLDAGAVGEGTFTTYDSLFNEPLQIARDDARLAQTTSRLLDGYGLAVLESPETARGVSLYYGQRSTTHGHRDTLAFELIAHGQRMMPDLGYPDQMNAFVPGIYAWSKNTISHNTVMIDRTQQRGVGPGSVNWYFSADGIQGLQVDAKGIYPQASIYRRGLLMIDIGPGRGYVLDVFNVTGGTEHMYSLHGPPGEAVLRGAWSESAPGTLAGGDVKVGELYDDPVLGKPGYSGGYSSYSGSGFSFFRNVQTSLDANAIVEYRHKQDHQSQLRIIALPEQGMSAFAADAFASPVRQQEELKYLLLKNHAEDQPLSSTFVTICETWYGDTPADIVKVERFDTAGGVAVRVHRGQYTDHILYRIEPGATLTHDGYASDGDVAVITTSGDGIDRAVFCGGSYLQMGDKRIEHEPVTGVVKSVDPSARRAVLEFGVPIDPEVIVGRHLVVDLTGRLVRHPVIAACLVDKGIELTFADALLIGRCRLGAAQGRVIATPTTIVFAPGYAGAFMCDEAHESYYRIRNVIGQNFELDEQAALEQFKDSDSDGAVDFWVVDMAPGVRARFDAVTEYKP